MSFSSFRYPTRRLACFSLLVLGSCALAGPATQAEEAAASTHAVGAWDLKLDNGSRQCRMMLRAEPMGSGYAVGMPVGCHLAFPFLASVRSWTEVGDAKIQFKDVKEQDLLAFEPGAGGSLTGSGPEGEVLHLESVGQHRAVVLKVASKSGSAVEAPTKAGKLDAAKPRLPPPPLADMAGHYAVLRKSGKDTGCMVTLDEKAHGPKGALKANLAPACRDQGIVIFDPVGWQLQAGQLVLIARKGHNAKFDLGSDGAWTKDAKEGANLSLKKMGQ